MKIIFLIYPIRIRCLKHNSEARNKEKNIFGFVLEIANKKKYFQ